MANHPIVSEPANVQNIKTIKMYVVGFALSLLLTLLAFAVVGFPDYSHAFIYGTLTILALSQLLVQVICFLRLNIRSTQDRWNLLAFVFTLIVVLILVSGSLWIMVNLNYYMMN